MDVFYRFLYRLPRELHEAIGTNCNGFVPESKLADEILKVAMYNNFVGLGIKVIFYLTAKSQPTSS